MRCLLACFPAPRSARARHGRGARFSGRFPVGCGDRRASGRGLQRRERLVGGRGGRPSAPPVGCGLPPPRAFRRGFRARPAVRSQRPPLVARMGAARAAAGRVRCGSVRSLRASARGPAGARPRADRDASALHAAPLVGRTRGLARIGCDRAFRAIRRRSGARAGLRDPMVAHRQRAHGSRQTRLRHRRLAAVSARSLGPGDARDRPDDRRAQIRLSRAPRNLGPPARLLRAQPALDRALRSRAVARSRGGRAAPLVPLRLSASGWFASGEGRFSTSWR